MLGDNDFISEQFDQLKSFSRNTLNNHTSMFELRVQFILERRATNCWRDGFLSCQRQLCPSITVGMVRDSLNKGMFLSRGWLERALSSFRATGSGSLLALSLGVASIFQRKSFSHSAAFVLFSRGLFYKIPFVPRSSYIITLLLSCSGSGRVSFSRYEHRVLS